MRSSPGTIRLSGGRRSGRTAPYSVENRYVVVSGGTSGECGHGSCALSDPAHTNKTNPKQAAMARVRECIECVIIILFVCFKYPFPKAFSKIGVQIYNTF